MKANYPIRSYTCSMCNKEIDSFDKDMLKRNSPDFIVEYYTCSHCGHKGRIFFNFASQEGLPVGHRKDEDWSYGEKMEPPGEKREPPSEKREPPDDRKAQKMQRKM